MKPTASLSRLMPLLLAMPMAIGAGLLPRTLTTTRAANTIVVNTATDSPSTKCPATAETLRCAMTQANADGSGDTIVFDIKSQCCRIELTLPLPALFATNTTIDGYKQPGAQQNSALPGHPDNARVPVNIDGSRLQTGSGDGLQIYGSNDVVDGLSITNFRPNSDGGQGCAIFIAGAATLTTSDTVWGNFLGLLPDGMTAGPNLVGVAIQSGASHTLIGGSGQAQANIISDNRMAGIMMVESSQNLIENNLIGLSRLGTSPAPNGQGIEALSENLGANSAQGDQIGPGNVISGNHGYGIAVGPDGLGIPGSFYERVTGNLIGTIAAGLARSPNGAGGVFVTGSLGTLIGRPGSGNVISGNLGNGITLSGSGSARTRILSNLIGLDKLGGPIFNAGDGVYIESAGSLDEIGLPGNPAAGNEISGNTRFGVELGNSGSDPVHVSISRNSFFGNHLGGISLNGQLPLFCTYGAAYIPNTTPNDLTPCPLVLAATPQRVTGEACTGCTVEVYLAPNGSDGEGKTWLGTTKAGACASPPCTNFTVWNLPAAQYSQALTVGEHIVATATNPLAPSQTSSFTRDVPVGQTLVVTTTASPTSCPSPPASESPLSLRCAIEQANVDGAGDEIDFNIPSADGGCASQTINSVATRVCTITPTLALPRVSAWSTYIDGYSQPGAKPDSNGFANPDNAVITIAVDGHLLASHDNVLALGNSYDSLEGLSLMRAPANGVSIIGRPNAFSIVAGTFVGLRPDATAAGNGIGVDVNNGAGFANVGGRAVVDPNVVSDNTSYGIKTSGAGGNNLRENIVGYNPALKKPAPNGIDGVFLYGTTLDEVGGFRAGEGNIVGNNFNDGVDGLDAKQASINGNYVLNNGLAGVFLYLGANNIVGGLINNAYGPNLIGLNSTDGVDVLAETGDTITNNFLGSNGGDGVMVGNTTAVTESAKRQAEKLLRRAGGVGSRLGRHAVVGGETPIYATVGANSVQGDAGPGLLVGQASNDSDVHVWAPVNEMSGNGGGIELYGSQNCGGSLTKGPNDNIPCPFINPSTPSAIQGFACNGCTVEVYAATPGANDANFGEGSTYLGSTIASASNGSWTFNPSASSGLSSSTYVTATATEAVPGTATKFSLPQFETSEFAYNRQLNGSMPDPRGGPRHSGVLPERMSHTSAEAPDVLHWRYPVERFLSAPKFHIQYRIR